MPIRLRLIAWYSSVSILSLIGFAVVIWLGTRAAMESDIDLWLKHQADGLENFLQKETHGTDQAAVIEEAREFSSGLPKGSGIQLFDRNGGLLLSRPETAVGLVPEQPSTVVSDHGRLRALSGGTTVAGEKFQFTLWRSQDATDVALAELRLVIILLVPAFLVVSVGGGWLLSRRALRPIDDITAAARRISLQDLSKPLPVPPHGDELQRLCEAWNEMLGRLDDSARLLHQFTADASHELRTPVAYIRTTAELTLRRDRSKEEYQEALIGIQKEAEQLTALLQNLMELARADAGHPRFSLARMDLRDLVTDVMPQAEETTSHSGLELDVDLPGRELSIVGDKEALRRLLLLLLDNAIKFTSAPGHIRVRARSTSDEVILEVEDTGTGIAPEDLPRIFDRFYQADDSRSGLGVGLGLSIAQWIAQGHNARIEVESRVGIGSTFRIFFQHVSAQKESVSA